MTELHKEIASRLDSDDPAIDLGRVGDMSYAVLAQRASALAAKFEAINPGQRIGILATRCWEAYAAVLASFFIGRCFVPLNPKMPFDRLSKIISHGQVGLIVHDKGNKDLATRLGGPAVDPNLIDPSDITMNKSAFPDPDAIAYQMFTSGSTGNPKGVPVRYGSLSHYVQTVRPAIGLTEPGRFSQLFDLSFDLAMHYIFIALANGGTIVPASQMDMLMPSSYISKKKIDHWFSVPMLAKVAAQGVAGVALDHQLKTALFCGEPLPMAYASDFQKFVSSGANIWNLYGPTEATIAFTAKRVDVNLDLAGIVPLGVPFGDNTIAVKDERGSIVGLSEGIEGELLLGGPQIFGGYRPANDGECFTQSSPIYYRSGDLVRMIDGELHHIGRTDSQIKLRGYRIELGDIEVAVRRAFGLEILACVVTGDGEGRQIALAYVADTDLADITRLDEYLPDYMKPHLWMRLDQMPLNINGKIDRKALSAMDWRK